ncbi:MAG: DUF1127 domain-containing protein [Roseobacter sp.]
MTRFVPLSPDTLAYLGQARGVPALAYIAVEFAATMCKWATRRQTRKTLTQLTVWQLEDVGLTPLEAHREATKAFWQV